MHSRIYININRNGMTIIEVMLYIALLSLLMFGFLQFAIEINYQNIKLSNDIQDAYR